MPTVVPSRSSLRTLDPGTPIRALAPPGRGCAHAAPPDGDGEIRVLGRVRVPMQVHCMRPPLWSGRLRRAFSGFSATTRATRRSSGPMVRRRPLRRRGARLAFRRCLYAKTAPARNPGAVFQHRFEPLCAHGSAFPTKFGNQYRRRFAGQIAVAIAHFFLAPPVVDGPGIHGEVKSPGRHFQVAEMPEQKDQQVN